MSTTPTTHSAIVLVASMLHPNRRQSFTVLERLRQTIDTLESIRAHIPNAYIIVIDGSPYNPVLVSQLFSKPDVPRADIVLHKGVYEQCQSYVDATNIGHGEHMLLERGVEYLMAHPSIVAPLVLKMGARYTMNASFDLTRFSTTKYTFRSTWDTSLNKTVFVTGLYGIPYNRLIEFRQLLVASYTELDRLAMVENVFATMLPVEDVHVVEQIGYSGQLSYNRARIEY